MMDVPSLPESTSDLEKMLSSLPPTPPEPEATPEYVRPITTLSWILICAGLFIGAILYGLDTTIAADVQGPILESLGEIEKLAWVGIGFPMGSVSVILLIGWCFAIFDIKYLMIGSTVVFEIGSAICGAAPNMNSMIIGRVIAGMGGAGLYMGALTYVNVFTSSKERPVYNAAIGLCWGLGCILGPVIGGGFAVSPATWRWAFYINLPLAAVVAPIYIFLFPKYNARPELSGPQKLAMIDWVGAALNSAVFTLFQVVLTFAGSTWEWNSAGPIALWVAFAVCLVLYVVQQIFCIFTTPETRLCPIQFLKSRTMILLYIGTSASATGLAVGVYYIPIFFQFTKGDDAIQAAVRLLPFICILIFSVMVSGGLLPVIGRYMPFYIIAGTFILIGGALMHTVDSHTKTEAIYGYEVLIAIGAGLTMQVGYSVVPVLVRPEEVQGAIGFINVAQIGTTAIALSLASSIFQNTGFMKLQDALAGSNFADDELHAALGGANAAILQSGDADVTKLAIAAISATISNVWILVLTAGAVSLVCGALMKPEKLHLEMAAG